MDLGLDSTGQAVAPIVACAFKLRWDSMLNDNARFHVLGTCLGYVGAIEWQGRGLPHGHVTVWLAGEVNAETLCMCVCVCALCRYVVYCGVAVPGRVSTARVHRDEDAYARVP